MSDRADEVVAEIANLPMPRDNCESYLCGHWHAKAVVKLRAYAEEARREERPDGCTCTKVIIHEGGCPAIRARKEKGT